MHTTAVRQPAPVAVFPRRCADLRSTGKALEAFPARSRSRRAAASRRAVAVAGRRNRGNSGVVVRAAAGDEAADVDGEAPPGCSRYSIRVRRPLGLVLEEDKQGNIFVDEIVGASLVPHSFPTATTKMSPRSLHLISTHRNNRHDFAAEAGNSEKTGLVNVGDQLLAVSAVVFNKTNDYGGVQVKAGEETIKFMTRGEKFDTVMAAIGTNPSQRLVTLWFQKCM